MAVQKGNQVKVHYTGRLESGEVFDSSRDRQPLKFQVGAGQMIPGFENAIIGMEQGEKVTATIPASEAYGERRKELLIKVPRENVPENLNPEVGKKLSIKQPDGNAIPVVVTEAREDSIILDANHPLAGKTLIFDIELVEVS